MKQFLVKILAKVIEFGVRAADDHDAIERAMETDAYKIITQVHDEVHVVVEETDEQ